MYRDGNDMWGLRRGLAWSLHGCAVMLQWLCLHEWRLVLVDLSDQVSPSLAAVAATMTSTDCGDETAADSGGHQKIFVRVPLFRIGG